MKWIKKGLIFCPEGDSDWMASHAALPFADWLIGSVYRIYFSSRDRENRSQTGYFEVDIRNPRHILYLHRQPILTLGELGAFDDSGAMLSWIVNDRDKKYLYYVGWNLGVTVPFRNAIGLAISPDGGRTWEKYSPGPILDRSIQNPYLTASSCILKEGDVWNMWYISGIRWKLESGRPKHYYLIKYAKSKDGIHWETPDIICIDFKTEDEYAISRPCVLKDQDRYRMWYSYRGESYRIGYAESRDGLHWERKDEEAGIDVSETGWDSGMIEYPFVFDCQGQRYMLYNGNDYGRTGIGLAVWAPES
jgi:hypothetical protein